MTMAPPHKPAWLSRFPRTNRDPVETRQRFEEVAELLRVCEALANSTLGRKYRNQVTT